MKKGLTKIIFVVDRSGSMQTVAKDMIGGFNSFIKSQKENNIGECRVSFYQFDTVYEKVFENVDVQLVQDLTSETFVPRGGTALLDAMGITINTVGAELLALPEDERPEKVLVVVITDGEENSSKEFKTEQIKSMVQLQTEKYSWQFVYIGANQDAWSVGQSMGINASSSYCYVSSGANTKSSNQVMWSTLDSHTSAFRSCVGVSSIKFSDEEKEEQEKLIKSNIP